MVGLSAAQQPVPQGLIACALDANAMPRARPVIHQVELLSEVIEQQELEAEIWLPEPVVWEWAQHLQEDLTNAASRFAKAVEAAASAGLAGLPEAPDAMPDVEQVLRELRGALEGIPHVETLELRTRPEAAVTGLRDQVLQLGIGRYKTGAEQKRVKTGAADSATYRLIESAAGTRLADVVVVSADKDVHRYFSREPRPVIIGSLWALRKALLALMTGSENFKKQVEDLVARELPWQEDVFRGASVKGGYSAFHDHYFDSDIFLATEIAPVAVERITSITTIDVSKSDGFAALEVEVELQIKLEAVWWNDQDDELEHESETAYGVPSTLQVSVEREDDEWVLTVDHVVIK